MSIVCNERPDITHLISNDAVSWAKPQGAWWGAFKWYFLNGGRFPWTGRGVHMGSLIIMMKDYVLNGIKSLLLQFSRGK